MSGFRCVHSEGSLIVLQESQKPLSQPTHTRANWQDCDSKRFTWRRRPAIGCSSPGLAEGEEAGGEVADPGPDTHEKRACISQWTASDRVRAS